MLFYSIPTVAMQSDSSSAIDDLSSVVPPKVQKSKKKKKKVPQPDGTDDSDGGGSEEDDEPSKKRGRKRGHGPHEVMSEEQEKDLVDFYTAHPIFYDQSLQGFKLKSKKERLLDELGELIGCSGEYLNHYHNS
jgi:hypothetical protein